MRHRICYVVSNIDRWISFEWLQESLQLQNDDVEFVLLNPQSSYFERYLEKHGHSVRVFRFRGMYDLPVTTIKLLIHFLQRKPDIVHTHFLHASLAGLSAAFIAMVPMRVLTRHHGTEQHDNHPRGVVYDRYCNRLATHIIAISKNVRNILETMDGADTSIIRMIPHGFRLEEFQSTDEKVRLLKSKHRLVNKGLMFPHYSGHLVKPFLAQTASGFYIR